MNRIQTSKIYPWVVVALLWVVALLNYMDRQMLSTMRDAMQFDITELESAVNFGRLMAIFLWIYGFMSPVAGAVADRISRKWLIVVSLGVWSTVTLLMGYSTTFTQIYWLRALMGVSEALYIPAGLSLIADYFTGSRRSLAIGIHGNVVRKDAVRQVRQMQVVRLRRTPRQHGQVVLQVADPAVAGFRKVYFPVHHSMLSVFGRRTVSCMKSASARTAAIRANPSPRLPPSAQPPRTFVTTAPAKTPVMFITP